MATFAIEPQEQSEWCWAAVAVSVDKYFNPASTLKQCEVADKVLGVGNCNEAGDKPAELKLALQKINRWRISLGRSLSFDELKQEIDAGRPVCVGIRWQSGGGHSVMVTGYDLLPSGAKHVHVEDPLNPSATVDLDEFTNAYHGDGTWTETDLVQSY